jgi:hypothetical protein
MALSNVCLPLIFPVHLDALLKSGNHGFLKPAFTL